MRLLAAAGVLVPLGAGCGTRSIDAPTGAPAKVVARIGHLQILHPYLPDPASPSVAAVYLTIRNTGSTADTLVSVATSAASSAMLMSEAGAPGGDDSSAGTMVPLGGLTVAAHGSASLLPGRDHVMLERPTALKVGQTITVTLRFARAGVVTFDVPVVPLSAIVGNDGSPATGPGTMKGMDMGSATRVVSEPQATSLAPTARASR